MADFKQQDGSPGSTSGKTSGGGGTSGGKLKKELGLFDVYVISTGAMFSSGFFLLPGLATAYAGPSMVLAYLLAVSIVLGLVYSMRVRGMAA